MRLLLGVEVDGCCSGCGDYLLSAVVEGDFNCDLCRSLLGPDSEGFRIHSRAGKAFARSSRSGDQSSFSSSHPALALFAVVVCHPVRKDDCSQELLHSYSSFSRDIPEFPVDVSLNCLHELGVQSSLPI